MPEPSPSPTRTLPMGTRILLVSFAAIVPLLAGCFQRIPACQDLPFTYVRQSPHRNFWAPTDGRFESYWRVSSDGTRIHNYTAFLDENRYEMHEIAAGNTYRIIQSGELPFEQKPQLTENPSEFDWVHEAALSKRYLFDRLNGYYTQQASVFRGPGNPRPELQFYRFGEDAPFFQWTEEDIERELAPSNKYKVVDSFHSVFLIIFRTDLQDYRHFRVYEIDFESGEQVNHMEVPTPPSYFGRRLAFDDMHSVIDVDADGRYLSIRAIRSFRLPSRAFIYDMHEQRYSCVIMNTKGVISGMMLRKADTDEAGDCIDCTEDKP